MIGLRGVFLKRGIFGKFCLGDIFWIRIGLFYCFVYVFRGLWVCFMGVNVFFCFVDFCWMCLGDWKIYGSEYYECSRYKENFDIVN